MSEKRVIIIACYEAYVPADMPEADIQEKAKEVFENDFDYFHACPANYPCTDDDASFHLDDVHACAAYTLSLTSEAGSVSHSMAFASKNS